jgi:hypothetical protein
MKKKDEEPTEKRSMHLANGVTLLLFLFMGWGLGESKTPRRTDITLLFGRRKGTSPISLFVLVVEARKRLNWTGLIVRMVFPGPQSVSRSGLSAL